MIPQSHLHRHVQGTFPPLRLCPVFVVSCVLRLAMCINSMCTADLCAAVTAGSRRRLLFVAPPIRLLLRGSVPHIPVTDVVDWQSLLNSCVLRSRALSRAAPQSSDTPRITAIRNRSLVWTITVPTPTSHQGARETLLPSREEGTLPHHRHSGALSRTSGRVAAFRTRRRRSNCSW